MQEHGRSEVGHVVVCGGGRLARRVARQLARLGVRVVRVHDGPLPVEEGLVALVGDAREVDVLRAAGIERAEAVVLAADDDVGNLHVALVAREVAPDVRIVTRMFGPELAQHVEGLVHRCVALSPGGLAAPAFVAAALADGAGQRVRVRERVLHADPADPERPRLDHAARHAPHVPAVPSPARAALGELLRSQRLRALAGTITAIALLSAAIFSAALDLSLVDALYFTATTMTTTGFGDITLLDAPSWVRLYGVGAMIAGAGLLAIFYVLLTDALVSFRIGAALGRVPRDMRGHVVVCGLGTVGYSVAGRLLDAGVPVVAVGRDGGRFMGAARDRGIPIVVGDARDASTLEAAHVARARAVVAATDDDTVNLEVALGARAAFPDVRVVARVYDPDLARRLHVLLHGGASRSVSDVAAPAFAAAALGARVVGTLEVPGGVHICLELDVAAGSPAAGGTVEALLAGGGARVLAVERGGALTWEPPAGHVLAPGDVVVVDGRSADLGDLVARVRP